MIFIWLVDQTGAFVNKNRYNFREFGGVMEEILRKSNALLKETWINVSDDVRLKLYDFIPENHGSGDPVVVFVAGWVSLIKGWRDVLKVLTLQCRVLYIETREKKSASLPEGKYPEFTVHRMGLDIHEVINEKIPENTPFYLAGSSLGSTVILDYMSREHYRMPEKSILISPIGDFDFPGWAKIIIRYFPPSAYLVIKHLVIWYLTTWRVDKKKEPEQAAKYEETISSAEPKRLQANARELDGYNVWDKLPAIKSKVVIVGAKTDKLHGLETLEKMVSLIPSAILSVMAGNKETHSDKAGQLILDHIKEIGT